MTDHAVETAVRRGFDKQGFMNVIGATLGEIEDGSCEIRVPLSLQVSQQHGLVHGGVIAALADNAAGFAAYTLMEDGRQPLTVEFKINFLAPARGEEISARARVLRTGRSISHVRSDVFSRQGQTEEICATALVTIKSTSAVSEV